MRSDEDRVSRYLEYHGLTAVRFSTHEMRASKTPDFRVLLGDRLMFFCEVKSSPRDGWLDQQLENTRPGELAGGNAYTEDGDILPIYKQFSEGRTTHTIGKIDLFIWLDDLRTERLFFGPTNQKHKSALCENFGLDERCILQLDT